MRFFFADNLDTVDPTYDFVNELSSADRDRQRDDIFPHEALGYAPYDGMLISRSTVLGGRYTQGQRFRLLREGAREFLRFPPSGHAGDPLDHPIMGDCGSFSYRHLRNPPLDVEDVIEFYRACGFTHGVSPDHVILAKNASWDDARRLPIAVSERAEYTLQNARLFLKSCREKKVGFTPIGVVQSWSIRSAAKFAKDLVDCGYDYIGLGGLVPRPTKEIYDTVAEVRSIIPSHVRIHIFGFSRIDQIDTFRGLNITSFDSTSPLLKAFKDDKHNYYSPGGQHYLAIKVPPLHETSVRRRVESGDIDGTKAVELERNCLESIRAYGRHECDIDETLRHITVYANLLSLTNDNTEQYRRTLADRPWERCGCRVCQDIGIEAVIFRGLNRNKRRGYHNLHVFYNKLKEVRGMNSISVPCIKTHQNPDKPLFCFVINGKDIPKVASISRIAREASDQLVGYQRPEISEHIKDIRRYLDRKESILPNSIVVAFNKKLKFHERHKIDSISSLGTLDLPIGDDRKNGLIVDGQQRVAAMRGMKRKNFPVSVVGFETESVDEEREQFILVNNTKPLPKSLIYELLPSMSSSVPSKLRKRQKAYRILERLSLDEKSPFYRRIKTATSRHYESANIKDVSVLRMIENSMSNGILSKFGESIERPARLLWNYWTTVREYYEMAWVLPPRRSRLTHGVGIISMGYIMDAIAYKLSPRWDTPPVTTITKELRVLGKDIPWTEGCWQFSKTMILPWNELQNTTRHIDLVTNYLIRKYRGWG